MGTTVREVLNEREASYGSYREVSRVTQAIIRAYENTPNWEHLSDYQKNTLRMEASKTARLLVGDPYHMDSWVDRVGYGQLAVDLLNEDLNPQVKKSLDVRAVMQTGHKVNKAPHHD